MCNRFAILMGLFVLLTSEASAQAIYGYRASDGTVHIALTQLTPDYRPIYGPPPVTIVASAGERSGVRAKLKSLVDAAARAAGVDPRLVDAMILVESGYDPRAVSRKGALGLMQLMPATARRFNVDPTIPEQNISGGTKYLALLLQEFGTIELALAAYNAGEGTVRRAKGIPNYPETIEYVRSVIRIYASSKGQ